MINRGGRGGCVCGIVEELNEQQRNCVTRTFVVAGAFDGRVRGQHRKRVKEMTAKVENLDFKKCLKKYLKFVQLGIDE